MHYGIVVALDASWGSETSVHEKTRGCEGPAKTQLGPSLVASCRKNCRMDKRPSQLGYAKH